MTKPRRLAISYSRFSDPKQADGDSEDRQDRMFRDFCQQHNLTPLTEVFADRGRSGYKDEHRKKGRLGQLVAMAKDGRFEPGTIIVVEAWDRLGRLRPDKQTELVAELLRTGVDIGICRLNDIFTEEDFGTHKWTTLAVFIQLAYQESKQKAERVAASWERRRVNAREKGILLTTRLPAWLEMAGDTVRPIPERAAAVKRIFQLAAQGYGHTRIVTALKDEGIPAFGKKKVNKGRSRSQFTGHWTRPYVSLILNDERAMGTFQPRKLDGSADGPPLVGYYPAVVSQEEFHLARAGQERRVKGRGKGPRQSKYVNLFKGLLRHVRDGEGFILHNKGTKDNPELVLVNASGEGGREKCYTFPYHIFEQCVLQMLREVNPQDVLPGESKKPSRIDVLRAQLKNVRHDIAQLQADLKEAYSKGLAAVLRDRETQEEKIGTELQEELARTVKPAARAWEEFPSLVEMIETGGDDARMKLRPVLRRVIDEIWLAISPLPHGDRLCVCEVWFSGGKTWRSYSILYRPGRGLKKARWHVRSTSGKGTLKEIQGKRLGHGALIQEMLNLYEPEDAKKLLEDFCAEKES